MKEHVQGLQQARNDSQDQKLALVARPGFLVAVQLTRCLRGQAVPYRARRTWGSW